MGTRAVSDAVLLARLAAGDDSALARAYDAHADIVYGVARRVLRDDQLAREVTQEVFVQLWQQPERVDLARGSLRTFLVVVAHRRAVDEVRRSERRHRAERRLVDASAMVEAGHEAAVVDEDAVLGRNARVHAVLDQLPAEQREAVTLAYFGGCTYREVAAELGIPEGTAKSRLRLALARLRAGLASDEEVDG